MLTLLIPKIINNICTQNYKLVIISYSNYNMAGIQLKKPTDFMMLVLKDFPITNMALFY